METTHFQTPVSQTKGQSNDFDAALLAGLLVARERLACWLAGCKGAAWSNDDLAALLGQDKFSLLGFPKPIHLAIALNPNLIDGVRIAERFERDRIQYAASTMHWTSTMCVDRFQRIIVWLPDLDFACRIDHVTKTENTGGNPRLFGWLATH